MPVFIYESDAFEKMIKIEGEEYRRHKSEEYLGKNSFDACLKRWLEMDRKYPHYKEIRPPELFYCGVRESHILYGKGGYNRYFLFNTGEIVFVWSFVEEVNIESAEVRKVLREYCKKEYLESAETEAMENLVKEQIRKAGFRIWDEDCQDEKRSG